MISGSGISAKPHRSQCALPRDPTPEAPAKARTAPTPPRQALRPLLRALAGVGRPRHRSTAVAGGCGHRHRFNAPPSGYPRRWVPPTGSRIPTGIGAQPDSCGIPEASALRLAWWGGGAQGDGGGSESKRRLCRSSKPARKHTPGVSWRSCSLAAVDRRATTRPCAFSAKPLISFNAPRPQHPRARRRSQRESLKLGRPRWARAYGSAVNGVMIS